MLKHRVLLIGYHDTDEQIEELVYEQKKLEQAGYDVMNITDWTTDPDTGVKINNADTKSMFVAMALNCDVVANYFGDFEPTCDEVMMVARAMKIPVRFSSALYWNKVEHSSDGWLRRMIKKLDKYVPVGS